MPVMNFEPLRYSHTISLTLTWLLEDEDVVCNHLQSAGIFRTTLVKQQQHKVYLQSVCN